MIVKARVAARVIMTVPSRTSVVPAVCKSFHRCGFPAVEPLKEPWIHHLAVSRFPVPVKFDRFCDQVFMACHQVDQVSEALWCVALLMDVNMDPTKMFWIGAGSGMSQLPNQLLQEFQITVV